jgi:hypothetical protein
MSIVTVAAGKSLLSRGKHVVNDAKSAGFFVGQSAQRMNLMRIRHPAFVEPLPVAV